MSSRIRSSANYDSNSAKMPETGLGPKKTMFVFVVVVGCFAVLWPKVFYPMLIGSANQHMQPSSIDKKAGCCDVISDTDVNTIKILSQICASIVRQNPNKPMSPNEVISQCRTNVLTTCGIDISAVLQEQVRLGYTVKHILSEIRSLNGSLCLKYNFGVPPWSLGVPHRVSVQDSINVKQERAPHVKPEMVHPAFRERGRAIPHPQGSTGHSAPRRMMEGKPGPVPGMRPPMGGPGHTVPPSQKGAGSMGIIMPLYTIGIVIFFAYTLMKVMFKKQPSGVGGAIYPSVQPDDGFRRDVFESEKCQRASRFAGVSSKLVVNAMSALLDEVDQEMEMRRKASELASQDEHTLINGSLSNQSAHKTELEQDQTSVKVVGMETMASCEGGQKWSRPDSPVIPAAAPVATAEAPPPQAIYLEGTLPAQSQLLVADSAAEPQPSLEEDPAVVLAGKMTLSVISMGSSQEEVEDVEKKDTDCDLLGLDEDAMDESKYTTVSGATAAENDLSEEEIIDDVDGPNDIIDEVSQVDKEVEDLVTNVINEARRKLEAALDKDHEIESLEIEKPEEEIATSKIDIEKIVDELISKHESILGAENVNDGILDITSSVLPESAQQKPSASFEETEPVVEGDTTSKLSLNGLVENGGVEALNGEGENEDEYEYEVEEVEVDSDYDGDDEIIEYVAEDARNK